MTREEIITGSDGLYRCPYCGRLNRGAYEKRQLVRGELCVTVPAEGVHVSDLQLRLCPNNNCLAPDGQRTVCQAAAEESQDEG